MRTAACCFRRGLLVFVVVEHRGNAPRATCLQGMSAPLCVSQTIFKSGARSWFRANLSAVSARRCHQISFPSWASCWSRGRDLNPRARFCRVRPIATLGAATMGRMAGIEPASSEWRSEAGPSSYIRMVGSGGNRTSCRKGTAFTAQRRHQPSLRALPETGIPTSRRPPSPRLRRTIFAAQRRKLAES
jgi:hypothetical protein